MDQRHSQLKRSPNFASLSPKFLWRYQQRKYMIKSWQPNEMAKIFCQADPHRKFPMYVWSFLKQTDGSTALAAQEVTQFCFPMSQIFMAISAAQVHDKIMTT